MIIAITGTPGTGKTTVAKLVASHLKYVYFDVNKFAIRRCLKGVDKSRKSKIIDTKKLSRLSKKFKGNLILDSHLSHFCKARLKFVLRCRPDILKKRLLKKGWGPKKAKENVDSEILGIIAFEAKGIEFDTTGKTALQAAKSIEKHIKQKTGGKKRIDWMVKYGKML